MKRGALLAAILLILLITGVIEQSIREAPAGYSIGGLQISTLSYADDIAAINQHIGQLQHFIDRLAFNSKSVGLNINIKKERSFSTSRNEEPMNLFINNEAIEQVQNFEYLGFQVSVELDSSLQVCRRIKKEWAAFHDN